MFFLTFQFDHNNLGFILYRSFVNSVQSRHFAHFTAILHFILQLRREKELLFRYNVIIFIDQFYMHVCL